jgi:DNA primase
MARVDFAKIKQRVTLLDVLARYDVQLRNVNQHQRKGKCPFPTHTSGGEPSFVTTQKKAGWVWACHSSSCIAARNKPGVTKKGGDLFEFVTIMEKCSLGEAGEKLDRWFGPFEDAAVERPEAPGIPSHELMSTYPDGDINKPLTFVLKDPNPKDPYLHVRGFDEEECEYLGVGFFRGRGMMENRIVFPIHNENGELIAYAGRSTDREVVHDQRWRFPPGFMKSMALYNLHRVEDDEVIVVESFWGVLACIRAGIMNAVSIMGTSISDWQAETLAHRFRRVILMLDADEYGREAIGAAVGKLVMAEVEHIDLVLLPKGLQPDEIAPDELRKVLRIADFPAALALVVEEEAVEA